MDTFHAIDTLRSVRKFSDQPITDEQLQRILNAGRRAGSAKNMQPWHFVVLRQPDRLQQLAQLGHWAGHLAGAKVGIALLSVHPDVRWSVMFDLGRAAQNMMLAAWAQGIVSCMATIYEYEKARDLLKFPPHLHLRGTMSFGYPAKDPQARPPRTGMRRTIDDVVHWEEW